MQRNLLGIDVGSKKIGLARVNTFVKIPQPLETIKADGKEIDKILQLVKQQDIDTIIVGWPRNMEGAETKQTQTVADFVKKLTKRGLDVEKQDESLTSIEAVERLQSSKLAYDKTDVDAIAACIILEDYLRR